MMGLSGMEVGKLGKGEKGSEAGPPPLRFTTQVDVDSLLNGCLMMSSPRLCVGHSAGFLLRESALCGGVLLIRLRVRLVMVERARQKGILDSLMTIFFCIVGQYSQPKGG